MVEWVSTRGSVVCCRLLPGTGLKRDDAKEREREESVCAIVRVCFVVLCYEVLNVKK